jgi:hypothetical protein
VEDDKLLRDGSDDRGGIEEGGRCAEDLAVGAGVGGAMVRNVSPRFLAALHRWQTFSNKSNKNKDT